MQYISFQILFIMILKKIQGNFGVYLAFHIYPYDVQE